MPRRLGACLHVVEQWPPAASEAMRWEHGSIDEAAAGYLRASGGWYRLGFDIAPRVRHRVADLWTRRPDLRRALGMLVGNYPCREFHRGFGKSLVRGGHGDLDAWFTAFPDLKIDARVAVIRRAKRANRTFEAIDACLMWARYLDGDDDAWRQLARIIERDDRREQKRPGDGYLRHELETQGTISPREGAEINRPLVELGAEPLQVRERGSWQFTDPDTWKRDAMRGWLLSSCARAAVEFERRNGGSFTDGDLVFYARALARLPAPARDSFETDGDVLSEIAARAQAMA